MTSLDGRTIELNIGQYELLELIGRGGTSSVFKAYDNEEGRYVAIKVLSPAAAANESYLTRFKREFDLVMKLEHPNIVKILDYGETQGMPYLVLPYFERGSLADRLMEEEITLQESARMIDQISQALAYAHEKGVVHRDVKPANILFDELGNALLSDFGLARVHDASMSLTGSAVIGTPAYMSPDQARKEGIDGRSDQYSLGVILFQLVTGQLPYEADTPLGVVVQHMHEPLPIPRTINPDIPEAIERVILKATAKIPSERFPTITDFNEVYQVAQAHALDPSAPSPPKIKIPRRRRRSFIFAGTTRPPTWLDWTARIGTVVAILLLMVFVMPVTSEWILNMLGRAPMSAADNLAAQNSAQLAELLAIQNTLEAFQTEFANAESDAYASDQTLTAVIGTYEANMTAISERQQVPTLTATPFPPTDVPASPTPTEHTWVFVPSVTPTATRKPQATLVPTPTPRMHVAIILPQISTITQRSQTNFEAEVWDNDDCQGSCSNGDGQPRVNFQFIDPNGVTVHNQTENIVAYCAFGGDSHLNCNLINESTWNNLVNGIYTLRVRARPRDGGDWSPWYTRAVTISKPAPVPTNTPLPPTSTPIPTTETPVPPTETDTPTPTPTAIPTS